MTCNQHFRDLISAHIDGELAADEVLGLERHLEDCDRCGLYSADAWALRRSLRVTAVPDTEATPAKLAATTAPGPLTILPYLLGAIGAALVILNIGAVFSVESGAQAHLSRHDGIFGTALGIAMLAVAAKPYRAIGLVPITTTVAVLMVVAAAVDLTSNEANAAAEAVHLLEFAGLICLWVISGGPSRLRDRMSGLAPARSGISHVPSH